MSTFILLVTGLAVLFLIGIYVFSITVLCLLIYYHILKTLAIMIFEWIMKFFENKDGMP